MTTKVYRIIDETPEPEASGCESAPGTLKRRKMPVASEGPRRFSRMFRVNTAGSPRLGKVQKFTK